MICRTPAYNNVHFDAPSLRGQRPVDEHVQVQTLYKYPHHRGADGVVEHDEQQLALPVLKS